MKKTTLLIVSVLCSGLTQAAPLKKCVDDKGHVYYGDSIPADVLDKCRTSSDLSNKGVVQKKTRFLTEEEKTAQEQAEAKQKQDDAKAVEQGRRDRALLDSYTDEREIDLSRDRNLQAAQAQIDGSVTRVKAAQTRLAALRKQADSLTRGNKAIPADLAEELRNADNALKSTNEVVLKWKQEYTNINNRFEQDKRRFRELKGYPPAQPAVAAPSGSAR